MRRPVYVASLFGLLVCSLSITMVRNSIAQSAEGDTAFNERVVRRVQELIKTHYVDEPIEFDKKLYFGALAGMTAVLDPHSQFLPPRDRKELEIDTQGSFGGLGIVIEKPSGKSGPIVIITPFLGTPASKAGIRPGDMIVGINGKSTMGMDLSDAVDLLRGRPGSSVELKIQRGIKRLERAQNAGQLLEGCRVISIDGKAVTGKKDADIDQQLRELRGKRITVEIVPEELGEAEDITVERAEIHVPSIEFTRLVDTSNGIGYVRLARFQEDSARKLREAIEALKGKGMKALVLDLRGNPGGLLNAAIQISDMFLSGGRIVSTRARGVMQGKEHVFEAHPGRDYSRSELPLVVLVNGSSASASEIVAAAVKDNGRGLVIGERTFGKGSVQKLFNLPLGRDPNTGEAMHGSLKLTTEKYYTPSGRSIQREPDKDEWGVEPDVIVKMSRAELINLRRTWEDAKIAENEDGTSADGSGAEGDPQLQSAVDILRGVLLFNKPSDPEAALRRAEPVRAAAATK